MAFQPPPPDDDYKKQRKTGVFGSLVQGVGDIVREVKQDLAEMTPPGELEGKGKKRHETSSFSVGDVTGAGGLAVMDVGGDEVEDNGHTDEKPGQYPKGRFKGNPWELLSQPGRMRIGCGYLAAEAADIWSYASKLLSEQTSPYTLGMVVATPQVWEGAWEALANEARLFGATGYGPRTLMDDMEALDDTLTAMLNDNPKLVAVGLLGLDEPYAPYALKAQQEQLRLQLELAADFGVPAYIGHRRSLAALAQTLSEIELPTLIWADPLQEPGELELVLKYGMHVLVRPELTHTTPVGLAYRELVAKVPPHKQLLSSGSTLVAAAGQEGMRNNLSGLDASLKALADVMGEEKAETLARCNANAQRLFYKG